MADEDTLEMPVEPVDQEPEPAPAAEPDPDGPCPVCGLRRGNRCSHV